MSGIYDSTLAGIHASAFAGRMRAAYPWLLATIQAAQERPVLHDLGCGNGAWLEAARDEGLAVSGSDLSPAFVALARARGLEIAEAPARAAPWPAGTTVITALGEVLSYIHDGGPSLWEVAAAAARTLPRCGLLIADLVGPGVTAGQSDSGGTGWQMSVTVDVADNLLTRRMRIEGGRGAARQLVHRQTVLDPASVTRRLDRLGFDVTVLDSYGPCPLLPGRFAIRAVRR